MHVKAIDAVRALLAWTVVVAHICWFTGADLRFPFWRFVHPLAAAAVSIFIIISGFVIANLLITKQEGYGPYIARRALRIFPVYLICLVVGVITTYLTLYTFLDLPWGPKTPHSDELIKQSESLASGLYVHAIAHVLLLQGIIPDNALYYAQHMFLDSAWSLSLEWQFYLVAPVIIWAMLRHQVGIAVCALAACAFVAYSMGVFGVYALPSLLPAGILLFLTGIITRLAFPHLPRLRRYPTTLLIVLGALALRNIHFLPLVAWAALVGLLKLEDKPWQRWPFVQSASGSLATLGRWSYSTYLVHVPVIQTIMFVAVKIFGSGAEPTLCIVLALTAPITLLLSFLLYRYVEEPTIVFGKRIFAPPIGLPQPQLDQHKPIPLVRAVLAGQSQRTSQSRSALLF